MSAAGVGSAIQKGLDYLAATQAADGSFSTYFWPAGQDFCESSPKQTVFVPTLILGALAGISGAESICRPLAAWLLRQQGEHGSFNYWARTSPERTTSQYPDDLDDTFCALLALHAHDASLVDGGRLAQAVRLLLATESQVGGPYRTWLVEAGAPQIWQDVDVAVNANIAYFLRRVGVRSPNLVAFLDNAVQRGGFTSPYYYSKYPVMYYLSRVCEGRAAAELIRQLQIMQQGGHWGTPQQTALASSALGSLGQGVPAEASQLLINSQKADGSWPAEAFWIDRVAGNRVRVAGSAGLTTALIVEALNYCQARTTKHPRTSAQRPRGSQAAPKIVRAALTQIAELDSPLRQQCAIWVRRMEKGDTSGEIILLPQIFARGLAQPVPALSTDLIEYLCVANIFGWIAYTIFDDFLDGEAATRDLPVATAALRLSLINFRRALPDNATFQTMVANSFNTIDVANYCEVTRYRFAIKNDTVRVSAIPRYVLPRDVANRSAGHCLTPLGVLAALDIPPDDPRAIGLQDGFLHYLAARQLNDDLHDWQADLRHGRASFVVAHLLRTNGVQPGVYSLDKMLPQLERIFWNKELAVLCRKVRSHIASARIAYETCGLLTPQNILFELLERLDSSMDRTLNEQQKAADFLEAYRRPR